MPLIGAVVVLIQFCFAFHVLKTGRPYWWIFVIMAFPVMGCVIYYFVEVFPGSREHRSANRAARNIARALQPDAELKKRVEELEVCGSVDNKTALAEECLRSGMPEEAMRLYASSLEGAYAADASILFGLAKAAVEAKAWDKAAEAIDRLKREAPRQRPHEVSLLEARMLDGRGESDAALGAYRSLVPAYVGLEARYRYGELLARLGKQEAAMEVFNDVLKHSKRFESGVEEEQRWAAAAREAVRGA
jgi:hypothetical protein